MEKGQLTETFQQIDDQLNKAWESDDISIIAPLLADEWILLEPGHRIVTKEKFLSLIHTAQLSHHSMQKRVHQVVVENDIAIVISRGKNAGTYNNESFDTDTWVTNIYKKVDLSWLCIMTQEAPVSC